MFGAGLVGFGSITDGDRVRLLVRRPVADDDPVADVEEVRFETRICVAPAAAGCDSAIGPKRSAPVSKL